MSAHRILADAVVADLNDNSFSISFTAERKYDSTRELKDFTSLRVTVVPSTTRKTSVGRNATQRDVDIDIAVQKKLSKADNEEIDVLDDLTDEIADFLLRRKVTTFRCIAVETKGLWSPDHMKEKKLFTSVATASFRRVET